VSTALISGIDQCSTVSLSIIQSTMPPQPPSFPRVPQGTPVGSPLSHPERPCPDCTAPRSAWLRGASTGLSRRAGRVGGAAARRRKIPCRSCIAMVPCALLIENRGRGLSALQLCTVAAVYGIQGRRSGPGRSGYRPTPHVAHLLALRFKHRANRPSQALFQCRHCGYTLHADLNAAKNIAAKYRASRGISSTGAPLSTGVSSPLPREERDKLPPLGDGR
jgi:hypothetical protein